MLSVGLFLRQKVTADTSASYSQTLVNANENYYYLEINKKDCEQLPKSIYLKWLEQHGAGVLI
jgi:hypothetical protein